MEAEEMDKAEIESIAAQAVPGMIWEAERSNDRSPWKLTGKLVEHSAAQLWVFDGDTTAVIEREAQAAYRRLRTRMGQ
jgi:hypothetical protein